MPQCEGGWGQLGCRPAQMLLVIAGLTQTCSDLISSKRWGGMEELEGFKRAILLNTSPTEGAQAGLVLGTGAQW